MGRRYYLRSRRTSNDPLRELASSVVGLIVFVVLICGIFAILSQPNAFRFSLGVTPTPTVAPNATSVNDVGIEALGFFAFCAIATSVSGLVILGVIWLAWKFLKRPKVFKITTSPTTPAGPVSKFAPTMTAPAIDEEPSIVLPRPTMLANASAPITDMPKTSLDIKPGESRPVPISSLETPGNKPSIATPPPAILTTSLSMTDETESDVDAKRIMSNPERTFFWTLSKAIQEEYYIFPQIPLRELASQTPTGWLERDLQWMMNKGVVDFLLVEPNSLNAVIVVERDDSSHRQADAKARDRRKEKILGRVDIPLLRFRTDEKWDANGVRKQIQESVVTSRAISFLDDSECTVFKLLRKVNERFYIFPKIPLFKIIHRKHWLSLDKFTALKRTLENESVDFVLAHPKYLGTLLVVSLDQLQYSEKGNLLNDARIPWISFSGSSYPTVIELREKINQVLPKWQ